MFGSNARIIDISTPLDVKTYHNNLDATMLAHMIGKPAGFEVETVLDHDSSFGTGQIARGVKMRLHVGSHIDAPEHWIRGGKQAYDLPLTTFFGEGILADCSKLKSKAITAADLEASLSRPASAGARILIRTGWNDHHDTMNYDQWKKESPYLTDDSLQWCLDKKPALLGIDFYHAAKTPGGKPVERTLVSSEIVTLTHLRNLGKIGDGAFTLIAFPLAIKGVEASPVRAIVIQ